MLRVIVVVAVPLLLWATSAAAQDHQHAAESAAPVGPMTGLGSHHHRITTSNAQAQRLFDQGLVLLYGFNHGQAIRMFQRAAELDPKAPMPLWGIALAYGPNINDFEMDRNRAKTADEYVKKAQAVAAHGTARERAYIDALSKRYSSDPNADLKPLKLSGTLAFMFESRYIIRPTKHAMESAELQHEYFEVWQGLKKNFQPPSKG